MSRPMKYCTGPGTHRSVSLDSATLPYLASISDNLSEAIRLCIAHAQRTDLVATVAAERGNVERIAHLVRRLDGFRKRVAHTSEKRSTLEILVTALDPATHTLKNVTLDVTDYSDEQIAALLGE